jgi:hypothetical protein
MADGLFLIFTDLEMCILDCPTLLRRGRGFGTMGRRLVGRTGHPMNQTVELGKTTSYLRQIQQHRGMTSILEITTGYSMSSANTMQQVDTQSGSLYTVIIVLCLLCASFDFYT